ncbi:MAG: methyl-accepting chemotaxis protein [Thermoleophilia bacterium]
MSQLFARLAPTSMRAKLLIGVLAVAAAALGAVMIVAIGRSGATNRAAVRAEVQNMAQAQAAELNAGVRDGSATATALAQLAAADSGVDRAGLMQQLRGIVQADPTVFGGWFVFAPGGAPGADAAHRTERGSDDLGLFAPYYTRDEAGHVTLAPDTAVTPQYREDFYRVPAHTRRFAVIEPYLDTSVHVVMTSYTAPIIRDGRLLGVAGVDVSLKGLSSTVAATHVLTSGYAMVVSSAGLVLGAPDRHVVGAKRLVDLKGVDRAAMGRLLDAGRTGHTLAVSTRDPLHGRGAEVFATPVGGTGWTYLVVAPRGEILAPTDHLRTTLIIWSLVGGLLMGIGTWLLVTRLTAPLRRLRASAAGLASGDITTTIPQEGRDEAGQVAGAFRSLAGYLRQHAEAAQRVADGDLTVMPQARSQQDVLGQALQGMVQHLRALVGDVAGCARGVADTAGRVADGARESRTAMTAIGATVGDVATGAARQRGLVSDTTRAVSDTGLTAQAADRSAEEGLLLAEQTREAMLQIAASSAEVTAAIGALEERSGQIAGIVDEVETIAQQTRMLALNASIEAARAGDAGRGFAVVADEVQELATRSLAAASTIGSMIAGTREEVGRAVQIVGDGARSSEAATGVVDRSREAFSRIRADVAGVQRQVESLLAASDTVAEVAGEAVRSTELASESSHRAQAATAVIDTSVQDLIRQSQELTASISRFRLG